MSPLLGTAAAGSRGSWIGQSDRALAKDGSWTRTPQALGGHREALTNTPAESLKPKKHRPAESWGEASTNATPFETSRPPGAEQRDSSRVGCQRIYD